MSFRCPSIEKELSHKNTPESSKQPFNNMKWYIDEVSLNDDDLKIKENIRKIMQGSAEGKDHTNDALHIFYAVESFGYFIVVDKRIIKKRYEIYDYLHEQRYRASKYLKDQFILTPEEFRDIVNN